MITTALCVSVFVLAVVSLAMLVLLIRVDGALDAELDSQTQALVALCNAVGLTQEERLDIDLACERAEFHRNRTGDLCEIIRMLGAEDKPFGELRAIVVDLVERKGKLDRYRAAIDAALGGVRRDGASWTNAHVPAINALKARLAVLVEVEEALGVHPFDDTKAAVDALVAEHNRRGDLIAILQEEAEAHAQYVARTDAQIETVVGKLEARAVQDEAQAIIDAGRRDVHPERIHPDSVVAIQNADGVLL